MRLKLPAFKVTQRCGGVVNHSTVSRGSTAGQSVPVREEISDDSQSNGECDEPGMWQDSHIVRVLWKTFVRLLNQVCIKSSKKQAYLPGRSYDQNYMQQWRIVHCHVSNPAYSVVKTKQYTGVYNVLPGHITVTLASERHTQTSISFMLEKYGTLWRVRYIAIIIYL